MRSRLLLAVVAWEGVYAFHTTGNASWHTYDWSQITTVCVFGAVDPQLLCKAHSVGARVTLGAGGVPQGRWNDTAAVAAWVRAGVARVQAAKADGLNLDIEVGESDARQIAGLTAAAKQMADAMHAAQPGSHVTLDGPSEGKTGGTQAACGDMYGRAYDFRALAQVLDFIVVMDYDSNDAHGAVPSPVHFEPASSPHPYQYATRAAAEAACAGAGFPRLCRKAELEGFTHCAFGWTSDWNGYWMGAAAQGCGAAGFNPPGNGTHRGPSGAYCCGGSARACPTCFFANAALPVVRRGVECYAQLGVSASKLVLAMPWYGYDYTCSATDAAGAAGVCHATAAVQTTLIEAKALLGGALAPGRIWQVNASTPHFFYRDAGHALHRVDYDDSQSLKLKYALAKAAGARGVGMWTASAIAADADMARAFWQDLKTFTAE
eukprot:g6470.t1